MKRILLIATGGTIASKHSTHGLSPQIDAEDILGYVPQVREFCEPVAIQVCNIDSTNMRPEHWQSIVDAVRTNYDHYDGFVVAHGTDTMAYTAAALSYMIQDSVKPVVITGAQKSIDLEITDAKTNLVDSFLYAADEESQGVQIVFGGKVIAGTRAKKIRSKSYNAFESIDYPYLAAIQDMRILRYIPMLPCRRRVRFYRNMSERVFLLKLVPGISSKVLRFLFEEHDCIIVESFGVGGIPASIADEFYLLRREFPQTVVIMATQVAHEGSDMTVYEVGNRIKGECKILESYDMTLEAVVAKAMWLLGEGNLEGMTIEEAFYKRVNYDIIFDGLK